MAFNKGQIEEAKKKLGESAAHIIASDLELDQWDEKGLKSCCNWHAENSPSLIWNKKENYFKCFGACGKVYSIVDHYVNFYKMSYLESIRKLFDEVGFDSSNISFSNENKEDTDYFKNYKYPKEETNTKRNKVEEYLKKRSISKQTLDFADIRQDSSGNIVFQYKDVENLLLCCKYRPSKAVDKGERKMWFQTDSSNCPSLFNKQNVDITKPLVITEGEIDALSVIEAGETNVVSVPFGSQDMSWLEFNWGWLENFEKIIVFSDDDVAGKKMLDEVVRRLGIHRSYKVEISEEVKQELEQKAKDRKIRDNKGDANNVLIACGKSTLLNLIQNAKDIVMSDVVSLMEFEEMDLEKINKIPFPYRELNKYTYGSIEASLSIWSGKPGTGKSTVTSHCCILEPIQHNEKVFVFSGELMGSQLKSWILAQACTKDHIIEWDNGEDKPMGYTTTTDAKKLIEKWAEDKIFFYNNFLKTKPEDILSRMEYVYRKYGVKSFVIDNIMVVDFSDYDNEYKAQSEFAMSLLRFAVRFAVMVNLVVHPKKEATNVGVSTSSISGTSNLSNLCHRLFFLQKCDKDSGYDVEIEILKDRVLGDVGKKVKLKYDKPTRRLYKDISELNRRYDWDDGSIKYNTKKFGNNGTLLELGNDDIYNEVIGQIKT